MFTFTNPSDLVDKISPIYKIRLFKVKNILYIPNACPSNHARNANCISEPQLTAKPNFPADNQIFNEYSKKIHTHK